MRNCIRGRWSNSLPVFPGPDARSRAVQDMGWPSGGLPMLTTVETAADLQALYELFTDLNARFKRQQRIVLTPFWVVGGPDFAAMRAAGCPHSDDCSYKELFWHNSSGGLDRSPFDRGDLRALYRKLYDDGLWRPEYHGRSHFDASAWTEYLKGGDVFARYYFERGMTMYHWGFSDPGTNTTHSLHCEYLADDPAYTKTIAWTRDWLRVGLESFRLFWGYDSRVTSVPTHHAPEHLGEVLAENGIVAAEGNQLDFVDFISRFEIDLDSYLQLGGAARVKGEAQRMRTALGQVLMHEDFVALQWHSQNALSSMYSKEDAELLLGEFRATIDMVRSEFPGAVFVTSSELAQLKTSGFSVVEWASCLLIRNHNDHEYLWTLPSDTLEGLRGRSGEGGRLTEGGIKDESRDASSHDMDGDMLVLYLLSEDSSHSVCRSEQDSRDSEEASLEFVAQVKNGQQVALAPSAEYMVRIRRGRGFEGEQRCSGNACDTSPLQDSGGTREMVEDARRRRGTASEGEGAGDHGADGLWHGRADVVSGRMSVWDMDEKQLSEELDEATAFYHARTLGNKDELQTLLNEGRLLDMWRLGLQLKRRADDGQAESLKKACARCKRCRTCYGIPEAELEAIDLAALPFAFESELFAPGVWQDRTAILRPEKLRRHMKVQRGEDGAGGGNDIEAGVVSGDEITAEGGGDDEEIAITFLSPRFGDVLHEPALISVMISGYDFEKHGGYAVLAAGGHQVVAFQGPYIETMLMGTRGHVPQLIIAALVGADGRPLGVSNSVVYWETWMPDPPRPGPKSSINASLIRRAPWRAGDQLPVLWRAEAREKGAALAGKPMPYPAPAARAPPGRRVSVVLTSCVAVDGRLTLLEETLESFLTANTYPIDRYILIDDSGDPQVHKRLVALFGDVVDLVLNVKARTGMTFSIDSAYSLVKSDYIFHCQDDWLFHTRGDFIRQSVEILDHTPEVMVVWCRDHRDHDLPMGPVDTTPTGVPFRRITPLTLWKGFTFNPGLRRVADYKVMAPIQRYWFEDYVQGYMRWMGQYGASLLQGWTYHTGEHHSTKPSYQAANEELAAGKKPG
jgi:hypothetical protein